MQLLSATFLALSWFTVLVSAYEPTSVFPAVPAAGISNVQFVAGSTAFDGPRANTFNSSTFQWWYFDAVAEDLSSAVVVVFFVNPQMDDPAQPFTMATFNVLLPNGTVYAIDAGGEGALIVTTVGDGSSGYLNGSGYSWNGAPDLSHYAVNINDPVNNIEGNIYLSSEAPAHVPCGAAEEGASFVFGPHLGWANSVPDSSAFYDLTIAGQPLRASARGYHDSNFGDRLLLEDLGTWYWGHATIGPYSLVWFDYIDPSGTEHQSGYLSKRGSIVSSSCGSITVRPTGQNSTYPPIPGATPSGFHIVYDMGGKGVLDVNVTNTNVAESSLPTYIRWIGSVQGGLRGGETYKGVALYEWMGG